MKRTRNIRFFIVFNDSFSRMLYHQYLAISGYRNNILIESAEDCLKKLDLEPDIIFMDYDMQPVNGLEALLKIKEYNPDIHVLLISCPNKKQLLQEAVHRGASGFITRGDNDLEMLRKAVEKIVAGKVQKQLAEIA